MIIQLTKFWITSMAESKSIGAQTEDSRSWTTSVRGEVRTYAGGRQRAIGSLGAATVWKVTLVEVPYDEVILLETWMGQGVTVFVRDHRGQSMYATFFSVERQEHKSQTYGASRYKIAVEFHQVDVVEGA
jgi:hypothetical protein